MSAPMTPERLAEILARAAAATPGPWCTDSWEIYQGTEYMPGLSAWIGETCRGVSGVAELEQDCADAAFVAAARMDVPDLVAEVQRLRAQVAALELAAAVDAMGAMPMPIAGALAEQRHLVDPQDHDFEHLADDRPTVVLPTQRSGGAAL